MATDLTPAERDATAALDRVTPALFARPSVPELQLSGHFTGTIHDPEPAYAAYGVKGRVQCEECVWCVHEAHGAGGAEIRSARVKRTSGGGIHSVVHRAR